MADYAISNVPRRVVYANTGVGPYAFTFEVLVATDIAVYRGSTLLTLTTDYTVSINTNGTGSVTLVTAGTGNITIVGARAIQRTSDYTTGGDLFASTLNTDLDSQTIYAQQVAETAERALKAPVVDPTDINMTLPAKATRAGTVLAFDSPSGNPVAGPSIASVGTVLGNIANINTVATNIASVNTVAGNISNVNTVAGISGNVTTVAGISANVTSVAGNSSNINTVAGSISNVNATGSNIASVNAVAGELGAGQDVTVVAADLTGADNIGTVAGSIADINALGPIAADIATVAGIETDVTTVAGIDSDVTTVSGIAANVTTVAGISANVTSVAGNATNINTVATNITNVNAVGSNIANVNSVAGNATNINAVVSNATNINTVAGISSNVTTVATNNANVTTVATNITNVNTNATNIANINQNAANIVAIQNASANATAAANSATAAASSATSASASAAAASAVALGNEPVRHSVRPSLLLDFANTKTLDPRITFTRGSTATFYDGKTVAKAEENLFTYSQEFDNAAWTKTNSTVTANTTTAPDGTSTAEKVASSVTATTTARINQASFSTASGSSYVLSVFAKKDDINFVVLYDATTNKGKYFNLDTGAVGLDEGGAPAASSITSVGNGWYRCTITVTASTTLGARIYISSTDGTLSYAATSGQGIFLWGAQLEQRSSVTAYTATTTAPITNYIPALQTAASGVARFEHNPVTGESLGLEIEEQRTNIALYSAEFDNAWWIKTAATVEANTVIAPDGTLAGDTLSVSTLQTAQGISTTSFTADGTSSYTGSIYVRKTGNLEYLFYFRANITSGNQYSTLTANTSTGFVSFNASSSTSSSYSVTDVGGWWRISVTAGGIPAGNMRLNVRLVSQPVGTTLYLWGAQLEAGAFATSYIPTTSATVTRSADSASMTGTNFSSWYNTQESTVYAEAVTQFSGSRGIIGMDAGSSANSLAMFNISSTQGKAEFLRNSSVEASITLTRGTKYVTAFRNNDMNYACNATVGTTDTVCIIPTFTRMEIGAIYGAGSFPANGTIAKVAYYPKRLTNAELQGLTTV